MNLPDDDPRHGTFHAYNKHGCRCALCTEVAWAKRLPRRAVERARARAAREAAGIKPIPNLRIFDMEVDS